MVLFEAARQAATAASGRLPFLPSEPAVSFSLYAELDSPCRPGTEVLDKGEDEATVRVSGTQAGRPARLRRHPHLRVHGPVRSLS